MKTLTLPQFMLAICCLLIAILVSSGTVRYTHSDARFSLLTSQSILENGTPKLNAYAAEVDLVELNEGRDWMLSFTESDSSVYYFYPIGTPVLSLPFVWVGNRLGLDMLQPEDDARMQIAISALLSVLIFLQLFRLARVFLEEWPALLFALGMFAGTSLISTLGTALWSQNFEILFILSALLQLARWEWKQQELSYWKLGAVIFAAWLCRPQSFLFVIAIFVWVAWRSRPIAIRTAIVAGSGFLLFVGWSLLQFGAILPPYFSPKEWDWAASGSFGHNFLAILFGPARGLFLFTPILLLPFVGWAVPELRKSLPWLVIWGWIIGYIMLIASSPMPWGGWSFGPRLLAELVPGFAVLLLLILSRADEITWLRKSVLNGFLIISMSLGVLIHTYQGLYNTETYFWNGSTSIDESWTQRAWDWDYPQFTANSSSNARKNRAVKLLPEIGRKLAQIPKNSSFLVGPPEAELRNIFAKWNADQIFPDWRIYNSLAAIRTAGESEFWFDETDKSWVQNAGVLRIDSAGKARSLGAFLQENAANTVLLSVRDEAVYRLSDSTKLYMRKLGSQIDSLKFREGYAAVWQNGKPLLEKWGPSVVELAWPGKGDQPDVLIKSAGMGHGNISLIQVGEKDFSLNGRGFNAVVLAANREMIWRTWFDTHRADAEHTRLYKGILSASK